MRKYRLVSRKGEGTFSEVLKAQNVKDGRYYAIKCMKNRFDSIDQVNNLREIQALRRLSPNKHIITLEEVLYDQPTGRLALVFELMDANLYELIRGRRHYLSGQLVKGYIYQLLKALDHMHRKGIFHRDIKPENILIESTSEVGKGLKLADFGSCRGIYSKQPYTEYISTRWYRAPECLLTDGYYGPEMDLWGAGCVCFEITSLYPLFPGTNELDQIGRIHKVLGTPAEDTLGKFKRHGAAHVNFDFPSQKGIGLAQLIPHASAACVDLITKLLLYDWTERITAREALCHPYFRELRAKDADAGASVKGTAASRDSGTSQRHLGKQPMAPPHDKALPTIGQGGAGYGDSVVSAVDNSSGIRHGKEGAGVTTDSNSNGRYPQQPIRNNHHSHSYHLSSSKTKVVKSDRVAGLTMGHHPSHPVRQGRHSYGTKLGTQVGKGVKVSHTGRGASDDATTASSAAATARGLPPIMGIMGSSAGVGLGHAKVSTKRKKKNRTVYDTSGRRIGGPSVSLIYGASPMLKTYGGGGGTGRGDSFTNSIRHAPSERYGSTSKHLYGRS